MQGAEPGLSDDINDYAKEGVLSSIWEGRGRVVAATLLPTKTALAIKIFDLEKCTDDFDLIQHEARMLREVRNPNLCSIIGTVTFGQEAWLLQPRHLCSVAELLDLRYTVGLPELAIACIARHVLLGLQYLHNRCIIHRGVQARHILISSCGRALLTGLRHSIEHTVTGSFCGETLHAYPRYPTPLLNWASPEMLHQDLRGYSYPSDVYSLGLTVCEMGNAEQPYQDLAPTLMMVEKLKGLVPFLHDASNIRAHDEKSMSSSRSSLASNGGLHLSGGDGAAETSSINSIASKVAAQQQRHFTAAAHEFVRRCLALEPQQRPSVQLLLHTDTFLRQGKRAGYPSLVSLLKVDGLTHQVEEEAAAQELEDKLAQVSIDDTSWIFEVA